METDFASSLHVPSLVRQYNSQLNADYGIGHSWSGVVVNHLEAITASSLLARRPDGKGVTFQYTNGVWRPDADIELTLTQEAGSYVLTLPDATKEYYNGIGQQIAQVSSSGLSTTFGYDPQGRVALITGPFGHSLTLGYGANNRVASGTNAGGQAIGYIYDTTNNLVRVNYPDATAKLYHYENASFPHHLTGISFIESNGATSRYATYAYDTTGKAVLTEHAAGVERFTLQYDSATQTTVRDAANTAEVMTFQTNLGLKNLVSNVNQSDGKSLTQTFDANNNLTCKKDEEGRVVTYTYNATNQKTSMTEGLTGTCAAPVTSAATRTVTYQYLSPTLDLPTVIQGPSIYTGSFKRTEIAYSGNLPNTITQRGYTPTGSAIARSVTLGYNSSGQVTSIDGPRTDVSDVTLLAYNDCTTGGGCGQLASITNALGHVTTFNSYDANGRLTQMTDANGLRTTYQYDARGRVRFLTHTPPTGSARVTEYRYNAAGDVIFSAFPDARTLTYTYNDARQLTRVTDNLGNYVAYGYDLKGNRTSEQTLDPGNTLVRQIDLAYDARNRLNQIIAGGAGGSVTQQLHDALGNLTSQTDPNQNPATIHGYDALNRLLTTVNALGGSTTYNYDAQDRLTLVTAPNSATTQYQYDDLGNLLTETSPDRGTSAYTYDSAGNLTSRTDAGGIVTAYTYDALNRLTAIDAPGTDEDVAYVHDASACALALGRLCRAQDEAATSEHDYDAFGNITQTRRTELGTTYATSYVYDAADRITRITYPDGSVTNITRDALGRERSVNTDIGGAPLTVADNITYRADGLPTGFVYGNGVSDARTYDLQGRLSTQTFPDPVSASGVDLQLMSLTPASLTITPGEFLSVSFTLTNYGTSATNGDVTTRFYLSIDSTITTADIYIGQRMNDVYANSSVTSQRNVYIPFDLTPGTYYLGAIVDPDNQQPESNETNNVLTGPTVSTPGQSNNQPPVANAGIDQTLNEGSAVTLSGSGTDSNGTIAGYAWTQTAGPTVTPGNGNTATATFTAPLVTANTILTFQLQVTDNQGATGTDTVTINVTDIPAANQPPTANAGPDQTVNQSTSVTLSGSGTDTDGTIASYQWTQTVGPTVTLANANTASASFSAPPVTANTVLTFQLQVTDNQGATSNDTVNVTVTPVSASAVDLQLMSLTPASATITPGEFLSVTFVLANHGTSATNGDVTTRFYLSIDSTITTADIYIGQRMNDVYANSSVTSQRNVYIPFDLTPGTYYLGAIVDPDNQQGETNENNNVLTGPTVTTP